MQENFVKIINATYRLLDFFPDNEPLKYKAKEKALNVMEDLILMESGQKEVSFKLVEDIEILKNYLQLGKYQGWVGGINFLILLKEYDAMKSGIALEKREIRQEIESKEKASLIEKPETSIELPIGKEKREKDQQRLLEKTIERDVEISPRQKKIIGIISRKGKAQVADIIKEIPNITKRTIRRDLDELLKAEKVVRSGEWNQVFYQVNPNKSHNDGIAPGTEYLIV